MSRVNLACALSNQKRAENNVSKDYNENKSNYLNVGLLDLDLFGPSIPIMMGLHNNKAEISEGDWFFFEKKIARNWRFIYKIKIRWAMDPIGKSWYSVYVYGISCERCQRGSRVERFNGMHRSQSFNDLIFDNLKIICQIQKWLQRIIFGVRWPALDILVIDMPPGTGDIQLGISQLISITGAIMVTSPQDVASSDVGKGIDTFRKLNVPVSSKSSNIDF